MKLLKKQLFQTLRLNMLASLIGGGHAVPRPNGGPAVRVGGSFCLRRSVAWGCKKKVFGKFRLNKIVFSRILG